jgi:hypothetical protein
MRLLPFSAATIEHFQYLERPHGAQLHDADGFNSTSQYQRVVPPGRLSPGPRDYETVGELYEVLAAALQAFVLAHGEAALFIGDQPAIRS